MKVEKIEEKEDEFENVLWSLGDWSHKYKIPGETVNFNEFKMNWKLFLLHPFLYPVYAALLITPFQ